MSIKRFVANKDTTITNAYQENLRTLGVNANMGEADSLEVFSLYGQISSASLERTRTLVQFPVDTITHQRTLGNIPASGSVEFYLRLFNVKHPFSLPRKFYMSVNPLSQSWEEGYGLDMEGYTDSGFLFNSGGYGATWLHAGSGALWNESGGDVLTGPGNDHTVYFETGLEDVTLDITGLVEQWIAGAKPNNGLLVRMSSSFEDGTQLTSFYTKKFSARGSEFYMNRPCIEARWDPSITDDRNNFYASSSLLSTADNLMNLYFYNRVGGTLKNVVGSPAMSVILYADSTLANIVSSSYSVTTNPLPGVYKTQISVDTTASVLYDKWVNAPSSSIRYFSGSFDVYQRENSTVSTTSEYIVNINNLKASYAQDEKARMNVFVREHDWQPNIYSVAYTNIENTAVPNIYYRIFRLNDNYVIINYSTGSQAYSKTSYDSNGNYFELDMNIFEKDYGYGIRLATWDGAQLKEFKDTFKFRIK